MLLLEALLWSGLERSDSVLNMFIGSEPGLRGELPASGHRCFCSKRCPEAVWSEATRIKTTFSEMLLLM
jgi:hypothetical protein